MTNAKSQFGTLRIVKRDRLQATPPPGLRQSWTEWQILEGRRVISRHGTMAEAERELRRIEQTDELPIKDLNDRYRDEGWGMIAEKALGIEPKHVESQARDVARYAHRLAERHAAEADAIAEAMQQAGLTDFATDLRDLAGIIRRGD